MEPVKVPSPLSLTGNREDNWHSWEQSFRRYIAASGEKDEDEKIDILLHTIGEEALEVYNTLTVKAEGDELTMEDVFQAFKEYCSAQKNVVFERYQYWSHQMTAGTSVNRLITELRQRCKDCEFGISEPDMLRDKLVLSITDSHLKKRLIQERGLTLERAIEICRATEQDETEHGVQEVPVDGELEMIIPNKSLHHNTRRQSASQCVPNTDQTEKLVLAAFTPKVQLHRLQLRKPSVTERTNNVEQRSLHTMEEPEMLSEGWEETWLCVSQGTNTAACPVKCKDEKETPQASQQQWRQPTEINIEEKPSTCTFDEFMKKLSVGVNIKGPDAAQNPGPSSSVLQGPDGMETGSFQDADGGEDDDGYWQKPLSESEMEADFGSTRKKRKLSDSSKNAEMRCKAAKTQICSKKTKVVQGKMASQCVRGKKASLSLASILRIQSGEKPFRGDVQAKRFNFKINLKKYLAIPTGENTFKCDVCSQGFIQKYHLQEHMRIHSEVKPFKCNVCNKCFNYEVTLMLHMKNHEKRTFICKFCRTRYKCEGSLDLHLGMSAEENPCKCIFCSESFPCVGKFKEHMTMHTGGESLEWVDFSNCFSPYC